MDIEIPDLDDIEFIRMCPECRGSLVAVQYDANAGPLKGKKPRPAGAFVEKPCTNCDLGRHGNLPAGQVPTRAGEKLMDFLKQLGVLDHAGNPRRG